MELEEMMEQYTPYLLKLSFLYVKDRQVAEDIVQDVFVKLYKNRATLADVLNPKSFLAKITINQCKDYLKSWHAKKVSVMSFLKPESFVQKNQLIVREEQIAVGLAVMKLPLKYREIIILYYFDEQTIPIIAELLHLPLGTVKTRLIKARKLLQESLENVEWEELLHET